ncbi:MAG: efflux RND transporter permease subunit [Phycisphaeraceae bacterium]|nr:efflux RND transporter permease subunit [Phycisphaeraceae bacterium]
MTFLTRFGVRQPVPINLLMVAVLVGGLLSVLFLRREFLPEVTPDQAIITMVWPGASPGEIEDSMVIKIEDRLTELEDIREIQTTISEGGGAINVEFRPGTNLRAAYDDLKRLIDSITDLPPEAERLQVKLLEPRIPVIQVAVSGDVDERTLKRAARGIEEDLKSLSDMGEVVITGMRPYELSIEVDSAALAAHGLSMTELTDTVRGWMAETPGGTIRTSTLNINVRTMGIPERALEIRDLVVRSDERGPLIRLGDIATVRDAFTDVQVVSRFNGKPSVMLTTYKVGSQDLIRIAESVRYYVKGRNQEPLGLNNLQMMLGPHRVEAWELGRDSAYPIPVGVAIESNVDLARFVEERLDLLIRNATYGGILVFLTLLVFLNWRVALWVGVGLTLSLLGTLIFMHGTGITLNLLTMFGLIVVLGLLVDDAIVVAENIQTHHDRGTPALTAAIEATEEVSWPVVATILTSVVAFLPLMFIKGQIGELMGALPLVVACALIASLIEALLMLPSHVGHSLDKRDRRTILTGFGKWLRKAEAWRDDLFQNKLAHSYERLLDRLLRVRYITVAAALVVLMISITMVTTGRTGYNFLPVSDSEMFVIDAQVAVGTPIDETQRVAGVIERAVRAQPETRSISTMIGEVGDLNTGEATRGGAHTIQLYIELHPLETLTRPSDEVIQSIRDGLRGRIDEVERIAFQEIGGGPAGRAITLRVRGRDEERKLEAVRAIKERLAQFEGVYDIADDRNEGQLEYRLRLKPGAAAAGFDTIGVASQIRGFLFGLEAHVFAADREDIEVRVRLDEAARTRLATITDGWIVPTRPTAEPNANPDPAARAVPLSEIAEFVEGSTYSLIRRVDRNRVVTVTADTAPGFSASDIMGGMNLPELSQAFPGVRIERAGQQQQEIDAFSTLPLGFGAAVIGIYIILAWLFGSYLQPLVVMLVIPFGFIGVVWGHMLLGFDITFLSIIGFVALSGIVVNDSLILVKFYNQRRMEGMDIHDALLAAGRARLRAILLTTITTFLGLTPLLLEQSFQARFLIPMAISVSMGLVAATAIVLIVLPCYIAIFGDIKAVARYLWHGGRAPEATEQAADARFDPMA